MFLLVFLFLSLVFFGAKQSPTPKTKRKQREWHAHQATVRHYRTFFFCVCFFSTHLKHQKKSKKVKKTSKNNIDCPPLLKKKKLYKTPQNKLFCQRKQGNKNKFQQPGVLTWSLKTAEKKKKKKKKRRQNEASCLGSQCGSG